MATLSITAPLSIPISLCFIRNTISVIFFKMRRKVDNIEGNASAAVRKPRQRPATHLFPSKPLQPAHLVFSTTFDDPARPHVRSAFEIVRSATRESILGRWREEYSACREVSWNLVIQEAIDAQEKNLKWNIIPSDSDEAVPPLHAGLPTGTAPLHSTALAEFTSPTNRFVRTFNWTAAPPAEVLLPDSPPLRDGQAPQSTGMSPTDNASGYKDSLPEPELSSFSYPSVFIHTMHLSEDEYAAGASAGMEREGGGADADTGLEPETLMAGRAGNDQVGNGLEEEDVRMKNGRTLTRLLSIAMQRRIKAYTEAHEMLRKMEEKNRFVETLAVHQHTAIREHEPSASEELEPVVEDVVTLRSLYTKTQAYGRELRRIQEYLDSLAIASASTKDSISTPEKAHQDKVTSSLNFPALSLSFRIAAPSPLCLFELALLPAEPVPRISNVISALHHWQSHQYKQQLEKWRESSQKTISLSPRTRPFQQRFIQPRDASEDVSVEEKANRDGDHICIELQKQYLSEIPLWRRAAAAEGKAADGYMTFPKPCNLEDGMLKQYSPAFLSLVPLLRIHAWSGAWPCPLPYVVYKKTLMCEDGICNKGVYMTTATPLSVLTPHPLSPSAAALLSGMNFLSYIEGSERKYEQYSKCQVKTDGSTAVTAASISSSHYPTSETLPLPPPSLGLQLVYSLCRALSNISIYQFLHYSGHPGVPALQLQLHPRNGVFSGYLYQRYVDERRKQNRDSRHAPLVAQDGTHHVREMHSPAHTSLTSSSSSSSAAPSTSGDHETLSHQYSNPFLSSLTAAAQTITPLFHSPLLIPRIPSAAQSKPRAQRYQYVLLHTIKPRFRTQALSAMCNCPTVSISSLKASKRRTNPIVKGNGAGNSPEARKGLGTLPREDQALKEWVKVEKEYWKIASQISSFWDEDQYLTSYARQVYDWSGFGVAAQVRRGESATLALNERMKQRIAEATYLQEYKDYIASRRPHTEVVEELAPRPRELEEERVGPEEDKDARKKGVTRKTPTTPFQDTSHTRIQARTSELLTPDVGGPTTTLLTSTALDRETAVIDQKLVTSTTAISHNATTVEQQPRVTKPRKKPQPPKPKPEPTHVAPTVSASPTLASAAVTATAPPLTLTSASTSASPAPQATLSEASAPRAAKAPQQRKRPKFLEALLLDAYELRSGEAAKEWGINLAAETLIEDEDGTIVVSSTTSERESPAQPERQIKADIGTAKAGPPSASATAESTTSRRREKIRMQTEVITEPQISPTKPPQQRRRTLLDALLMDAHELRSGEAAKMWPEDITQISLPSDPADARKPSITSQIRKSGEKENRDGRPAKQKLDNGGKGGISHVSPHVTETQLNPPDGGSGSSEPVISSGTLSRSKKSPSTPETNQARLKALRGLPIQSWEVVAKELNISMRPKPHTAKTHAKMIEWEKELKDIVTEKLTKS